MNDKDKALIGLGQHISGRTPERCWICPYSNGDAGYGITCRDELLDDLYEMLEAQEPHVMTLEETCARNYCFFEYRATGYIEPASVVMSGLLLNDSEPLMDVYRLGHKGPEYMAMNGYGHEWRCWDRMPEDGQKEEEPWQE